MSDTVGRWLEVVHRRYPPAHASDWDEVGLHVGDPDWPVERVLVTLDVTTAVVAEAAEGPPTLVLAHHPLLFRPLQRLTSATASGAIALRAARSGVAVAAAHTNLDTANDGAGTSDPVVRTLDLGYVRPLTTELRDGANVKLVVYVPPEALDGVMTAIWDTGGGHIGDYDRCSFRVAGTGTFRPLEGTDPYSGRIGEVAHEEEQRLEVVVPRSLVGAVVRAMVDAHPYEEVAYDLFPTVSGADVGFGRIGTLKQPMPLRALAARVRDELPAPHLRYAGNAERVIRTVATVGGAGESLIGAAVAAGADVFVTGDLKHHVVLDALTMGLALVDAGHHATEQAAMPAWIERLHAAARAEGLSAELVASTVDTTPWAR